MSRKKTWNASKHFLTPLQTARLLNTCEETIYRLLARKEMSGLKVGRAWRIPVSQFGTYRIRANDGGQQSAAD